MEKIDYSPLKNAAKSFDEIIERYHRETFDDAIRDALIQRFEYTYSLTLKFLSRFLKQMLPEMEDNLTFNEIIREANKFGLLYSNLEKWTDFRQKRNLSSHTYDAKIALRVAETAIEFQTEVHYVLQQLQKND